MRLLYTILLLRTMVAFGQDGAEPCHVQLDTLTKQSVYNSADEMASFPGGIEALARQIQKRIYVRNVDNAQDGIKVYVAFIVQTDGKVVGQRVTRNVKGTNLAEQFLDIIDDVRWKPGICDGKTVATIEILPMIIDLAR